MYMYVVVGFVVFSINYLLLHFLYERYLQLFVLRGGTFGYFRFFCLFRGLFVFVSVVVLNFSWQLKVVDRSQWHWNRMS